MGAEDRGGGVAVAWQLNDAVHSVESEGGCDGRELY